MPNSHSKSKFAWQHFSSLLYGICTTGEGSILYCYSSPYIASYIANEAVGIFVLLISSYTYVQGVWLKRERQVLNNSIAMLLYVHTNSSTYLKIYVIFSVVDLGKARETIQPPSLPPQGKHNAPCAAWYEKMC